MKWHYWSDTYTNERGENLSYCLKNYGIGGQYDRLYKDTAYAVIYTD